jgi:hypothetical protein
MIQNGRGQPYGRIMTYTGITILTLAQLCGAVLAYPAVAASPSQSVAPPAQAMIAPTAPPPQRLENVSPPSGADPEAMYWHPGHWVWDASSWRWEPGQYANRPVPLAAWEPGHWVQQPDGNYVWIGDAWEG